MHRGQTLLIVYSDLQQLLHQLGVGGATSNKSQGRRMKSTTGPSSESYHQVLLKGTTDWTKVLPVQRRLIQLKKVQMQVCCTVRTRLRGPIMCFLNLKFYILY